MAKKLIISIILVFSLFLALASASTEINVKTLSFHRVHIYVLDANSVYSPLESYHLNSDYLGMAKAVYSGTESKIKVKVQVAKETNTIQTEDFTDLPTGSPLYLQVLSGNVSSNYKELESSPETPSETNTTSNNETNTTGNNETEATSILGKATNKITGFITSVRKSVASKTTIYIIGGVVVVIIIVGFFAFKMPGITAGRFNPKIKEETTPQISGINKDKDLLKAQETIKELQKEVNTLKKQGKIKEIERKLEEEKKAMEKKLEDDKKELEKLKSED